MKEKINRLKITELSLLVIALVLIFNVNISYTNINNLGKIQNNVTNIHDYYLWSNQINDMIQSILALENNVNEISDDFSNITVGKIKENKEAFTKEYNEYTSTESDEEECVLLENIAEQYKQYSNLIDAIVSDIENGGEADYYEKQSIREVNSNIISNLQQLKTYINKYAEEDFEYSNFIYKKIITITIVLSIVFIILVAILLRISNGILTKSIIGISEKLHDASEGNLAVDFECKGNRNELSIMKRSLAKTFDNFNLMISELKDNSNNIDYKAQALNTASTELKASVENIYVAINDVSSGSNEQANYMLQISEILNVFSEKIDQFINSVKFLQLSSDGIHKKAGLSSSKMEELTESFSEIENSMNMFMQRIDVLSSTVQQISGISNMINEISEQTNLLALNAAIESARAGEAGKGFAVVAEEVRTLAEESKKSCASINSLIESISDNTSSMVTKSIEVKDSISSSSNVISETVNCFKDIILEMEEMVSQINILNTSSEEIMDEKNIISEKVESSTSISEEINASCEEISASVIEIKENTSVVSGISDELNSITNELETRMEKFKIK